MNRISRVLTIAALVTILSASISLATSVTFSVDMSVQEQQGYFNASRDSVFVAGSMNGWNNHANRLTLGAASIYSATIDIPAGNIEYKFTMDTSGTTVWESVDNRPAAVGESPMTLPTVFFNNVSTVPLHVPVDVEVLFSVNMTVQQLNGSFHPDVDLVAVRGGHDSLGNWGGAVTLTEDGGNPGVYTRWIKFENIDSGAAIEYKFKILPNGDPNSNVGWESNDNRSFIPTGTEPDNLPPPNGNDFGDIIPATPYFSNLDPSGIITSDLHVIFRVDIRPIYGRLRDEGYIYDVQTQDTVRTVTSIEAAGYFNGWPWGNFSTDHELNDNGINGDAVAGDSVWSRDILFAAGSPREMIYKYGANMLDVEAGFARNHSVRLDDTQPTFSYPIDCFGSPDTLYEHWSCLLSDAPEHETVQPNVYLLEQNFPNPFNPTTAISFTLPRNELVNLRVFDVLGREVTTLTYGKLAAGKHTVGFDGASLASGVYFYRIEAGSFNATRKMLLLK